MLGTVIWPEMFVSGRAWYQLRNVLQRLRSTEMPIPWRETPRYGHSPLFTLSNGAELNPSDLVARDGEKGIGRQRFDCSFKFFRDVGLVNSAFHNDRDFGWDKMRDSLKRQHRFET
jgi:hypothetical protein